MTKQINKWMGKFGKDYTKRNAFSPKKLDQVYKKTWGIARTELNQVVIGDLDRNLKILEVGSNVGDQLLLLQRMGFEKLYGIEINSYAIEWSKSRTKNINIIQGSAFDIPFKDNYFDLVFTSGVLIHIAPADINSALKEIYRCAKKYIWGFEYYTEKYTEIVYRGEKNLLWKANFPKLYTDLFKDLELIKEKKLKYLDDQNIDIMFLFQKRGQ